VKAFSFGVLFMFFIGAFAMCLTAEFGPRHPCRCLDCKCCPACPCPDDCHDKPEPCKDS
jgi:hypothetical protein